MRRSRKPRWRCKASRSIYEVPDDAEQGDFPLSRAIAIAAIAGVILASCGGPKVLTLPTDPIDRAATCGIVAAAEARTATAANQKLPLDAEGHILHYALLAGSADGHFSAHTAGTVSKRMNDLQATVTEGKWQDLAPACRAAFPATATGAVILPKDRLDAELGCSALADFLATALEGDSQYAAQLGRYRRLRARLSDRMGPALRARAGSDLTRQRAASDKAMAAMAQLGSPVAVLNACLAKFD